MDSEGKLYESNIEFDIGIKMIQMAFVVLKVSRMNIKIPSGERPSGGTVRMMTSSIMKVSLRKLFYGD